MKRYVWVLTVGLLALTGAAPGDDPARPGTLSASGRVVGPWGPPVARGRVTRRAGAGGDGRAVATYAAGRFTLGGLAPDQDEELVIIHPGRKLGARLSVRAGDNKNPAPLEVKLQPLASAGGRVLDEDKRPIAGAPVTLL